MSYERDGVTGRVVGVALYATLVWRSLLTAGGRSAAGRAAPSLGVSPCGSCGW